MSPRVRKAIDGGELVTPTIRRGDKSLWQHSVAWHDSLLLPKFEEGCHHLTRTPTTPCEGGASSANVPSARSTILPAPYGPLDTTLHTTVAPLDEVTVMVVPIGAPLLAQVPLGMVLSQVASPPWRAEAATGNVTGEATGTLAGGTSEGATATGETPGAATAGTSIKSDVGGDVVVVSGSGSAGSVRTPSRRCRLSPTSAADTFKERTERAGPKCTRWTKYTIGPTAIVPPKAMIVSQRRLLRWATW